MIWYFVSEKFDRAERVCSMLSAAQMVDLQSMAHQKTGQNIIRLSMIKYNTIEYMT